MRTFLLSHDSRTAIPVFRIIKLEINYGTYDFGTFDHPDRKQIYQIEAILEGNEKCIILDNIKTREEAMESLKTITEENDDEHTDYSRYWST